MNAPRALAAAENGDLYLALRECNAVYRLDTNAGRIFHVAGTGETDYTGDGGPARAARLAGPKGTAWAPGGSLYLADTENHAIRRIDLKTGTIVTVAGTGRRGDGPDGNARQCRLSRPHGVFVTAGGTIYVAGSESHRIRTLKWDARGRAAPAAGRRRLDRDSV